MKKILPYLASAALWLRAVVNAMLPAYSTNKGRWGMLLLVLAGFLIGILSGCRSPSPMADGIVTREEFKAQVDAWKSEYGPDRDEWPSDVKAKYSELWDHYWH